MLLESGIVAVTPVSGRTLQEGRPGIGGLHGSDAKLLS
jgi:hypothetical protein